MLTLNRIGIGTGAAKNLTVDLLHAAYDLGMNVVDTSPRCGSEEVVGKSLQGRRDKVYVITKVSPEHMKTKDVIASCERSLKVMGTDYIDLYTTHWPNPAIPVEETVAGLMKLRDQGKIRGVGVGNVSLRELVQYRYLMPEINSVQNEYNLFDRSMEMVMFPYCEANKIQVFAYSPLDGGNFCGGPKTTSLLRRKVASYYNFPMSTLCLTYLLRNSFVFVLPRIKNVKKLKEFESVGLFSKSVYSDIKEVFVDNLEGFHSIKMLPSEIDLWLSSYKTIDDATHNYLGRSPEPLDMAKGELYLKPLKVRHEGTNYVLVEGFMRYWAHVLALGNDPIDVLVRE